MSIEIRELVIKSTIVDRPAEGGKNIVPFTQAQREALLRECRQLVTSLLRERGER
ncbi:DUF5908 family protein [Duganella radicis]|uniref:Uncharacterized protein n=1 Tax=Duganella radicis TaxID=551988 RepID=A0A6L6PBC5_9BURK|nr:DUF5908 family protein [Duganella radicis]MTV36322.1 hypothetical protein [Duganella radicis]